MATTQHSEITVPNPPAEVMDKIADVEGQLDWSPMHKSVVVEESYEDGRPKLVRSKVVSMGITDEYLCEYTWNGDESMRWELLEGTVQKQQTGVYTLTPTADGGTHIAFELTIDLKVPVPGFILKQTMKASMKLGTKGLAGQL